MWVERALKQVVQAVQTDGEGLRRGELSITLLVIVGRLANRLSNPYNEVGFFKRFVFYYTVIVPSSAYAIQIGSQDLRLGPRTMVTSRIFYFCTTTFVSRYAVRSVWYFL